MLWSCCSGRIAGMCGSSAPSEAQGRSCRCFAATAAVAATAVALHAMQVQHPCACGRR